MDRNCELKNALQFGDTSVIAHNQGHQQVDCRTSGRTVTVVFWQLSINEADAKRRCLTSPSHSMVGNHVP